MADRDEIEYKGGICDIRSQNKKARKRYNHEGKTARASCESENSRARAEATATQHGIVDYSCSASAGASAIKAGDLSLLNADAKADAEFGEGGAIAGAKVKATCLNLKEKDGNVDLLKGYAGGEAGFGRGGAKAMVKAGVDLINSSGKISENVTAESALGLNASTGFEAGSGGVRASVLGVGVSLGRTTGISLPFGRFNVKFD